MDALLELLTLLNTLSPLAVIALLGCVIFMLVKGHKDVDTKVTAISTNHLSDMPEIVETLRRIELSLSENFAHIRARLNGRGPQ